MQDRLSNEQIQSIKTMPGLSHYPDRTKPFSFNDSHVIQFLETEFELSQSEAIGLFKRIRRNKWILFDSATKLWLGCACFKRKYNEGEEEE